MDRSFITALSLAAAPPVDKRSLRSAVSERGGALGPGTEEWKRQFGRVAGCRDPHARLRDMNALGTDQVMLFPTWFVRLALVRDP